MGRLLASPLFARHWATIWRRAWIPQADTPQFTFLADDADYWLAARIREHAPHDRIVRKLLQVSSTQEPKTPSGRATPRVFLVAGEFKRESLWTIVKKHVSQAPSVPARRKRAPKFRKTCGLSCPPNVG